MKIIGITGPTGSGKTTALQCISSRGGVLLDLDAIYHDLVSADQNLLNDLNTAFPGTVVDGKLQRKKLGAIVFADEQKLNQLNEITGKYILNETLRRIHEAAEQGIPVVGIDAINLLEGELKDRCDSTVAVTAPVEVRVRRLMARDNITEDYARLRISAQRPNEYYEERCDYTLRNIYDTPEEFAAVCNELFDKIC